MHGVAEIRGTESGRCKMKVWTGRLLALFGLGAIVFAVPALSGCTASVSGTPPSPTVAPGVNTAPEPLENPDLQDSPVEESESVHATGTP
jgi:hypothetical protein